MNVNGNFVLGSGTPSGIFSTNWQAKDSLSWTRGRHQMKFGYELLHLQFEQQFLGAPSFNFTKAMPRAILSPISCLEGSTARW